MRKVTLGLAAVAALCFALIALNADAEPVKVAIDKLPKAVVDSVKKRFPDAELVSAMQDTIAGKAEYEVSIKSKGQNIDVNLSETGVITLLEKQIEAKDLPKPVTATLEKKYAKAEYQRVEEVVKVKDGKEALDYYEVLLNTADKRVLEVSLFADGRLLKIMDKSPEIKKETTKGKKKGGK